MQPTADIVSGKTQYPKMQTLWKNDIVPPKSCALTVTTAAPNHTITNTAAKTKEALSPGADKLKVMDNSKHTSNGPQRSPNKFKL